MRSIVISKRRKIEERGLRHLKGNSKGFQAFFENLKSVEKRPRYEWMKGMLIFYKRKLIKIASFSLDGRKINFASCQRSKYETVMLKMCSVVVHDPISPRARRLACQLLLSPRPNIHDLKEFLKILRFNFAQPIYVQN